MSLPQDMQDPRLFDFWSQLLRDLESGKMPPLEHYLARFPGLEAEIEREYRDAVTRARVGEQGGAPAPSDEERERPRHDGLRSLLGRLSSHPPRPGRYAAWHEIGRGGMGIVHETFDDDLRRTIALKTARHTNQRALAAFLDEAQITGQLDHPGIVPVHELGVDERGNVYFTMRLVNGRTLADVFRLVETGDAEWTQTRALNVVMRVCEAMAYAHSKGVIHRDLKPANVMCGEFGEVYVMDWGLARLLDAQHEPAVAEERSRAASSASVRTTRVDELETSPDSPLATQEGDVVGTPNYMPPEQAAGDRGSLSARSDVYSIGAMLYQLLARRPPYADDGTERDDVRVLQRVLRGPPKQLTSVRSDIPAELVAICEKAMARDPTGRYPDMSAMASDLRAFLEQRVVGAYRVGAWQELKKWCARNRATAGVGAFAILLAIGTIGVLWRALELRDEKDRAVQVAANEKATSVEVHSAAKSQSEPGPRAEIMRSCAEDEVELEKLASDLAQVAFDLAPGAAADRTIGDRLTKLSGDARVWCVYPGTLRQNAKNACESAQHTWRSALVDLPDECARATAFVESLAAASPDAWAGCLALARHREERARAVHADVVDARFPSPESRDDHDRLVVFVERLQEFTDPDPRVGVAPLFAPAPDRRSVAELVPLGPDPATTQQEFAVDGTGTIPVRVAGGRLALDENSAVVLVLVAGCDAWSDAGGTVAGEPAVASFYAAKDEVTLGQWLRAGNLPSREGLRAWAGLTVEQRRSALTSPVVDVGWGEASFALRRIGLRLPSDAQWRCLHARSGKPVAHPSESENTRAPSLSTEDARALGAYAGAFAEGAIPFGVRGLDRLPAEWTGDEWRPLGAVQDIPGVVHRPNSRLRRVRGSSVGSTAGPEFEPDGTVAFEVDRSVELGIRPVRPLRP